VTTATERTQQPATWQVMDATRDPSLASDRRGKPAVPAAHMATEIHHKNMRRAKAERAWARDEARAYRSSIGREFVANSGLAVVLGPNVGKEFFYSIRLVKRDRRGQRR